MVKFSIADYFPATKPEQNNVIKDTWMELEHIIVS
jgi:hypothetical protein